jgi:hypothetical protein
MNIFYWKEEKQQLKKKKEEEAKVEEDFCYCRASALFSYSSVSSTVHHC